MEENQEKYKNLQERIKRLEQENADLRIQLHDVATMDDDSRLSEKVWDASVDGMVISDKNATVIKANKRYYEIYGYSEKEVIGKNFAVIFPDEYHKTANEQYRKVFQSDQKPPPFEVEMTRKDGAKIMVESRIEFIYEESEKIAMLSIIRDITVQKKVEHSLIESEERFNAFMNHLPGAAFIKNMDNVLLYCNKQYAAMLKTTPDKIIGTGNHVELPPELSKKFKDENKKVIEENQCLQSESTFPSPKGDSYWFTYKFPINTGEVKLMGAISIDITTLKETENELRENEKKYRFLTESTSELICLHDPDGTYRYLSPSVKSILGYDVEELVGQSPYQFFHPEDLERINKESHRPAVKGKNIRSMEYKIRRKDGKYIWFDTVTDVIKNDKGKVTSLITRSRDITDKKRTELKLYESEALYKTVFESSSDGIFIYSSEDKLEFVNDAACKMHKMSEEELMNLKPKEFIHPDSYVLFERFINTIDEGKEFNGTGSGLTKSGEKFDVVIYGCPIILKGKKLYFSNVRDITLQKKYENELIIAKEKAEESDKLKSAFLANMSHEIRTPMNGIIGFSKMFTSPDLSEDKRNYYAKLVIDSSNQLLTIVNDILDISRIETDRLELHIEEVNLNDLIMEVYSFFKPQMQNKTINFLPHRALKDDKCIIRTDSIRLKQILNNLLNNAFKFTQKGHIKFGYDLIDKEKMVYIKFFVEDTGIGINKEMHHKIFEPFRQAELSLNRKYGGTGLGLSISQKLVTLLQGQIWLESVPDTGTTFYFTIPYDPVYLRSKKSVQSASEKSARNWCILIVEDEETNYLYIEEVLSLEDIQLLHAKNGREAIELCESKPEIDLVLMDIKMPVMNGHEATKIIKKMRPSLPVIAQTAYAMREDEKKAMESGCDDYLSKPVEAKLLMKTIKKFLS